MKVWGSEEFQGHQNPEENKMRSERKKCHRLWPLVKQASPKRII